MYVIIWEGNIHSNLLIIEFSVKEMDSIAFCS